MNIHKLSEYKTYAHNHEHKPQINQALAENFSLNKNFKDKRSLISDPNANMKDLDKKKDKDGKCIYILDDEEENKKINILIIENLCRPLLLKTYKHFEQIKSTPKQKLLLQECYENAKEYMNIVDTTKDNINNQRLRNIAKVCRGETFLFSSNDKKIGYFFEIEKAAKQKEGIPQIKKGERFFRRHIDNGVDLKYMISILKKMKEMIHTYQKDKNIRYGISSSRLRDKNFLKYREEKRKEQNSSKPSAIIQAYKEAKIYIAKNGILENTPIEGDYEDFKAKFIDKEVNNSLTQTLKSYEKAGNKLEEGGMIIDLDKINIKELENINQKK